MIATSIEQSKKLLELGLNPESADMMYLGISNTLAEKNDCYAEELDTLAWSLDALLRLIPNYGIHYISHKCSVCFYSAPRISPHATHISDKHNSLFDAVFEMVVWMIENKYIETKK